MKQISVKKVQIFRLESLPWLHKMHWNIHFSGIPKLQPNPRSSLRCRCDLTPVSNVCKAVLISLFWVPSGLNKLLELRFKFPFNLIGKMTMLFLTGQSWCIPKSWYTVGGWEQGFQRCFADGHNQTREYLSIISIAVNDFSVLFKFSGPGCSKLGEDNPGLV